MWKFGGKAGELRKMDILTQKRKEARTKTPLFALRSLRLRAFA